MRQLLSKRTSDRGLMTKTISRLREGLGSSKAVEVRKPITYLTENGFSIVRRCELDEGVSSTRTEHCFVVRDPDDYELAITVHLSDRAVAEVISRTRGRLTIESGYWIVCAERHLADYLWENADYPPDGILTVDQLTLDDLDLARRWHDETHLCSLAALMPLEFSSDGHGAAREVEDSATSPKTKPAPIKLLTENGYTILRRSEIDPSVSDSAKLCRFSVEDPNHVERDVRVSFDDELIADIQHRRRNLPLSMQSQYWLVCAETQLATYLFEHNHFPADGSVRISELPGEELLMAQHWRDAE
jgi:hypothetical protein